MKQGGLFESVLGEDVVQQRMTLALLEQWLAESAPSEWWLEGFLFLRSRGVRYRDAILATWLSLSADDRGEIGTREDLARLMGVSRAVTYQWERKRPQIRQYAEVLQVMRLRGARLAEVDQKTYDAAVGRKSTSADRKLYYQRAGVWEEAARIQFGEAEDPFEFEDVSDDELAAIEAALVAEAEGGGAAE